MPLRKRLRATAAPSKTRKGGRRKQQSDDDIPQVFQDMLAEAAMSSEMEEAEKIRTLKRRKLSEEPSMVPAREPSLEPKTTAEMPISSPEVQHLSQAPQQIIYKDFGSSEDESDVDFEDVAIEDGDVAQAEDHLEQKSLQLDLSKRTPQQPTIQRRKPVSKEVRDYRLNVHKAHLLLLLVNLRQRRLWCESEDVQVVLKPLIPHKLRNMLHVGEEKPAYQRSHSFNKAIEEICTIWQNEFKITRRGMRKAYWREDFSAINATDELDDPSSYEEFLEASGTRNGSRDLGAMLFCALLRSAAVETRLVCSLQVLPFSAVAKGQTPEKPKQEYAYRATWPTQELPISSHEEPSNPRWRQSEYAGASTPTIAREFKKKIQDSPYPIFWVEVMLPTNHTWIPLDPLVRKTINKPKTGFEPPLSDHLNSMAYVIAVEETGYAIDVTRRYTQFFNAKTRKQRVESTKQGDYWWKTTMQWFRRFKPLWSSSQDEEQKELQKKSANEPMPKNMSDFKDHPIFALERHLRKNEVFWPNEHRGFFHAGNKDGKREKVYDRKNVHIVRSADQWYRRGRDLKIGEQPLKRASTQRKIIEADIEEEDQAGTLLYAEFQTELYVPPPVVRGRIPKNQYGNLDVYVPSMIPPGAIHLKHPEARNAARILGVDFTDAVTGFKFKGRQGTAIINGIVAAVEYRDALVEVVEALEYQRVKEQEEKKSTIALSMWKKFLAALRVRERIHAQHAEHEHFTSDPKDQVASLTASEEEDSTYEEGDDAGGGFMPDVEDQGGEEEGIDTADMAKLTLDPEQSIYHEVLVIESPHKIGPPNTVQNGNTMAKPVPSLLHNDSLFDDEGSMDDLFGNNNDGDAGGFFREDSADAEGGGFCVDNDDASTAEGGLIANGDEYIVEGGSSIHERSVESGNEVKQHDPGLADSAGIETETKDDQISAINKDTKARGEEEPKVDQLNDDVDSLLSHDPEDDDAEEAWAMDIDE